MDVLGEYVGAANVTAGGEQYAHALWRGKWKFIRDGRGRNGSLYNLERDPDERHDQANLRPDVLRTAQSRVNSVVSDSRSRQRRVGAGEVVRPSNEMEDQLRALGYLQEAPTPEPGNAPGPGAGSSGAN